MRSIQDSEDEDEEVSPVKPRHQAAVPIPEVANSLDKSTDSTDTQLRKAHLALIEPTPTSNMVVSESPAESRKRRSTATDTPASTKKTKTAKVARSQSTQASQLSFNSAGVQDAIHYAYVLQPTGDTERMGTVEQEQAVKEALVAKAMGIEPEPVAAAQDELGNQSSPMPWSAGPSEIRTQSTEQAAQVPRSTGPNSDDLIGLPREQYQARASRSRSTQIADVHIDWHAVPEKVAKKKRRKTADCPPNDPTSSVDPLFTASPELRKSQNPRPSKTAATIPESEVTPSEDTPVLGATVSVTEASHQTEIAETPQEREPTADHQTNSASQASHHSAVEVRIPARSSKTIMQDKALLEMPPPSMPPPTMPPPSIIDAPSKRGRKSKRSHTTIFEDHIGLEPVLPSQNLKQQQAARKTDATGKRGRGRPKKADAEKAQEPASVVEETPPERAPLEDSPPKEAETPKPASQPALATPPAPESSPPTSSSPSSGRTAREAIGTGKENDVTRTADLTLSAPSHKKSTIASPNEPHSPIKTGKNVFRVGLSKRQRIKPLLKIIGR